MSTETTIRFGGSSLTRRGDRIIYTPGEAGIIPEPTDLPAADCNMVVVELGGDETIVKWQADIVCQDQRLRLLTYKEDRPGAFPDGIAAWAKQLDLPFTGP